MDDNNTGALGLCELDAKSQAIISQKWDTEI